MRTMGVLVLALALASGGTAWGADAEGGRDHPLLTRMPGFAIDEYAEMDFDRMPFADRDGREVSVEGKRTTITYLLDPEKATKTPSEAQILQNHANAVAKLGGKTVFAKGNKLFLEVRKEGAVTWVAVRAFNQGESYTLDIAEGKRMEQEVTADAAALSKAIAETGKAAVYGIYFDTGAAVVKPESEPTLAEIARLLGSEKGLRLHVVGHTDSQGDLASNMRLSQARAAAVVKALAEGHGADKARLSPAGVGPLAPVATNRTEEGRALNRRVELVAQ